MEVVMSTEEDDLDHKLAREAFAEMSHDDIDYESFMKDLEDAKRWRQLMSCERIRFVGSARVGKPDAYVCMEFWGQHPEKNTHEGATKAFIEFLDGVSSGKAQEEV
jgi:hypothetical protein